MQSNHSVEMCWCFFLFDLVTSFVDVLFEIVSMIEVSHLANGILLTPMGLVNKTASPFLSFFPVDGSQCMQFDQKPTDRQLPICLVSAFFDKLNRETFYQASMNYFQDNIQHPFLWRSSSVVFFEFLFIEFEDIIQFLTNIPKENSATLHLSPINLQTRKFLL